MTERITSMEQRMRIDLWSQTMWRNHIYACEVIMNDQTGKYGIGSQTYAENSRRIAFNLLTASQLEHFNRD